MPKGTVSINPLAWNVWNGKIVPLAWNFHAVVHNQPSIPSILLQWNRWKGKSRFHCDHLMWNFHWKGKFWILSESTQSTLVEIPLNVVTINPFHYNRIIIMWPSFKKFENFCHSHSVSSSLKYFINASCISLSFFCSKNKKLSFFHLYFIIL